jgi:sarcosine oxidase subunit gamma
MRPLPAAHRFVLHGDAAARTAAQIQWRVPFAAVACRAQVDGSRATLWMGPDEYLLLDLSPVEPSCAAAEHLEAGMQGLGHALIDVSQRQVAFEVFGPQAELILNGGCPLDLDVAEFPIGMCTRTVFAKADILLWRTGQDTFHVEVWRSFAEYLIGALNEVAAGL